MSLRSYKYRIYPTFEQKVLLSKTFGCVRNIWNNNVFVFMHWSQYGPNLKTKTSTEYRNQKDYMQEVSAAALQQKEIDFKTFKNDYFSKTRKKKIGKPSFKKKFDRQSFRLPNQKFKLNQNNIRLEKIGNISIVIDKYIPKKSKFMSVTISKDKCNNYFAAILVEQEITPRFTSTNKSVGIDLGLNNFLITSSGEKIDNPRWFRENQMKLTRAQRRLSKKKKASVRFRKCKLKVARIHKKISNQRRWFHHQTSLDLVRNYDFIGIESLNVDGMKRNHKLAKSISDAGWSRFIKMVKYKAEWNKKIIQEIDRFFPSSKRCSKCSFINHEINLENRDWLCPSCGTLHDRDINAANNIEVEAIRLYKTAQGVTCA